MIVKDNDIKKYLEDFHAGRIAQGDGIGCEMDDYLRFKKGTFNLILGRNGVGKTYFKSWHYLALSMKYNYKWCIWTGENKAGQIIRDLTQWYTGKYFKTLSIAEVYRYQNELTQWFTFVDNSKMYKYTELLSIFEDDYTGCLIDPFTGLDRGYSFGDNYDFLNNSRQWVNRTGITLDVCTHPTSASGRAGAVYPKDHNWAGFIRNPYQSDVEGGDAFSNRMDDFICLHRMKDHPDMKTYTQLYVYKIKDRETGGKETDYESPVLLEFNAGLGFKVGGINPLREKRVEPINGYEAKPLPVNRNFYEVDKEIEFNNDPITDVPF